MDKNYCNDTADYSSDRSKYSPYAFAQSPRASGNKLKYFSYVSECSDYRRYYAPDRPYSAGYF
jgi:hypothetical protein